MLNATIISVFAAFIALATFSAGYIARDDKPARRPVRCDA
ncbi:hypothetical protein J2X65_003960 [Ancylobacter sp. 3268]|nr:hypothetical protein [Ancylobacter sp. 3268]